MQNCSTLIAWQWYASFSYHLRPLQHKYANYRNCVLQKFWDWSILKSLDLPNAAYWAKWPLKCRKREIFQNVHCSVNITIPFRLVTSLVWKQSGNQIILSISTLFERREKMLYIIVHFFWGYRNYEVKNTYYLVRFVFHKEWRAVYAWWSGESLLLWDKK